MTEREIIICRDVADLTRKAAKTFVDAANISVACGGRFAVALSGGSTPKSVYSLLSSPSYRRDVPWSDVHLFWGDERCVPPDHAESNFHMVQESLLSRIKIPPENIHRMAGEKEPLVAACEYEDELREFFNLAPGQFPRFDLILLGVGEDGHTASLFPGTDAVSETERLAVSTRVEKLGVDRLTLTLPVLNHSDSTVVLVAGASKAAISKRILESADGASEYPAARVTHAEHFLTWLVTQDAATGLST